MVYSAIRKQGRNMRYNNVYIADGNNVLHNVCLSKAMESGLKLDANSREFGIPLTIDEINRILDIIIDIQDDMKYGIIPDDLYFQNCYEDETIQSRVNEEYRKMYKIRQQMLAGKKFLYYSTR